MAQRILIPTLLALLMTGCGQKGPLYFPDSSSQSDDAAPATEPQQPSESGTNTDKDDAT